MNRGNTSTPDLRSATIGVLLGGMSSEREVSLRSGRPMAAALRSLGYRVVEIDVDRHIALRLQEEQVEVAVIALHGTYGEDGCIQGLLEVMGIPYTGSGVGSSALAMDKEFSKLLFQHAGLRTPRWKVLGGVGSGPGEGQDPVEGLDGYPVVVKPVKDGSSMGITIVRSPGDLSSAIHLAASHGDGRVMIEQFIAGAEITVSMLDGEVLGSTEIIPGAEFYDYDTKYNRSDTVYHTPAPVDPSVEAEMQEMSHRVVKLMKLHGACRVDFMVEERRVPYLLEVNTLPGMTSHSLLPMGARHKGLSYEELVERITLSARLHR